MPRLIIICVADNVALNTSARHTTFATPVREEQSVLLALELTVS